MATGQKVIKNNQSIAPFLGERMSFIRGLDPLGLQNTSDATFSYLLPGLNNVTGRIRYYSFYSWLLDEYSKRDGSTDPENQRKFIRKAEYIVALSSQYYDSANTSIPGSNYANTEVQFNERTSHDLNAGIAKPDGSTAKTYWNYRWGAFGQYYLGSLRDIGIVINRDDDGVYARTNSRGDDFISGQMLASAFNENVSKERKELFFRCLERGEITEANLKDLLPDLNLTRIPEATREQQLLIHLLLQKDFPLRIEEEPSINRKSTIYHLLEFVKSEPERFNDREFVYHAYDRKGYTEHTNETSMLGWCYYQFNEFWQYLNTSLFNGTLDYLENTHGPNWVPLSQFIDDVTKLVVEKFEENGYLQYGNESINQILNNCEWYEFETFNDLIASKKLDKVFQGFLMMFAVYIANFEELIRLKEYGEQNELAKDGEGLGYFILEFQNKLDWSLYDFMGEYLYKNIIYRHQYVAFRKIGSGGLTTQKFIIEDHHIRYLGNFEAGYTGPRLGSLIAYLQDLHIITKENALSRHGEQILIQENPTND
jgi:hypothetical protein